MDAKKFTIISIIIFVLSLLVFVSTVVLVFFKPIGGLGEAKAKKKVETQSIEIGGVSTQVGDSGRYYKGHVFILVTGKKTPEVVEKNMPKIKDSIISSISYSDIDSITSQDGMTKLKEKIRLKINEIIGTDDVTEVLFTESILQ